MFNNIKNFFDAAKKGTNENEEYLDEDIFSVLSLLIEASKIDGTISSNEIQLIKKILVEKFHLNSDKADKAIKFVVQSSEQKVEMYSDIKVILEINKSYIDLIKLIIFFNQI